MKTTSTPLLSALQAGQIAVLGVPFDEFSSFMRGAAFAPARIREALYCESTSFCTERGIDLNDELRFAIFEDLQLSSGIEGYQSIEQMIGTVLDQQARSICLGGDHSISYPIIKAYAKRHPQLTVIHLDAHPDLYDEYNGNRYSHACPFTRVMEDRLASRLIQIGIRNVTPFHRAQMARFSVETIFARSWHRKPRIELSGPVYLSLDLDVLDPAFAPGVSHYEPGGLTTRDVIDFIQQIDVPLVGADIVELNPLRDTQGITAAVAAKLLKEIAGKMLNPID